MREKREGHFRKGSMAMDEMNTRAKGATGLGDSNDAENMGVDERGLRMLAAERLSAVGKGPSSPLDPLVLGADLLLPALAALLLPEHAGPVAVLSLLSLVSMAVNVLFGFEACDRAATGFAGGACTYLVAWPLVGAIGVVGAIAVFVVIWGTILVGTVVLVTRGG